MVGHMIGPKFAGGSSWPSQPGLHPAGPVEDSGHRRHCERATSRDRSQEPLAVVWHRKRGGVRTPEQRFWCADFDMGLEGDRHREDAVVLRAEQLASIGAPSWRSVAGCRYLEFGAGGRHLLQIHLLLSRLVR